MAQSQSKPKKWATNCEKFLDAVRSLPSHKASTASQNMRNVSFSIPNAAEAEVEYIKHAAQEYDYALKEGAGRVSTRAGGNYVAHYEGE